MTAPTLLNPDTTLGLALAVVGSLTAPALLLSGDLKVIAVSDGFCRSFHLTADDVRGREIYSLGAGEWDIPQLRSLLKATASGDAEVDDYVLDITGAGQKPRHLVLNARNLSYGDTENIRVLLTVADVTDARAAEKLNEVRVQEKDAIIYQKDVQLRELRHRTANSLQIIAAIIMQIVKKTRSDETRGYLTDVHSRVMAVAELQRQFELSHSGAVKVRDYFTALCKSISDSMIGDRLELSLTVDADGGVATSDVSVSLGLITTELVINALKHAFPDGRSGKIIVHYKSNGPNWTLSVSDDGVGIPNHPDDAPPGLGTSIVRALAHQLGADVQVANAAPGTVVSIIHREIAATDTPRGSAAPAV